LDYAGFDTYDSLYRAKKIFGVDIVVLFTQDFHLKRAMYISQKL
jgi:SanA protein